MNEELSYNEAMERVLEPLEGPISRDEFIERVLTLRPSTAKKPRNSVLAKLREYEWKTRIVKLDKDTLIPARTVMRGQRFALTVERQEAERGALSIWPGFQVYLRRDIEPAEIRLEDEQGHPLPTRIVEWTAPVSTIFGPSEQQFVAFDLREWFRKQSIRRNDYVLVTVLDWQHGHFRLEHEKAKHRRRHREEIEAYNRHLADALFALLEAAYDEYIYIGESLPTALTRVPESRDYPGDHWLTVVNEDPRMRTDGLQIKYADGRRSMFETMLGDLYGKEPEVPPAPVSGEEAHRVYRFKAMLSYNKGLWRRIEILGGQTLSNFDRQLRWAFDLDTMDHLSGFWKRVRRGKGNKFREVDLGTINPFERGEAADVQVASLDLEPGNSLKYVYDFGDWVEFILELEALDAPEEGAEYPRVVAQNRPRHRYCEQCKEEGRESVATWICIECSNEEQRDVLVCDACLTEHHPDHYADEILY
ncbi:MAG: IS1096 element passenger TnpR family protein [Anaerolineales bacterium]